jgi:hypothetical protein
MPSPLDVDAAAWPVLPSAGAELLAEDPPQAIRPAAITAASATAKIFFFIVSSLLE